MSVQNTVPLLFSQSPQREAITSMQAIPTPSLDATYWIRSLEPLSANEPNSMLLQRILEGFSDGVLLLNDRGEWVDGNLRARRICQQMNGGIVPELLVPEPIGHMAQLLLESISLYPGVVLELESEMVLPSSQWLQVQARWMPVEEAGRPLILVRLIPC